MRVCMDLDSSVRACILLRDFSLGLLHERKFVSWNFDLFRFCSSFSSASYNYIYNKQRLLYCCTSGVFFYFGGAPYNMKRLVVRKIRY